MTYQEFRPSGLPYEAPGLLPVTADAFSSFPGVYIPATFGGNASLSDNSDATYLEVIASQDEGAGEQRTSVVGVDFAAIPGLVADARFFGGMARFAQYQTAGATTNYWYLVRTSTGEILSSLGRFSDYTSAMNDPAETFQTFSDDYWMLNDGAQAVIQSEGFTVAFFSLATRRYATDGDAVVLSLYEFGLRFDVVTIAPPYIPPTRVTPSLRMLQRGGSGGMSGIPRMVGDPTRRGIRQGPGSVY